ncbi:unnamed protein product, partial [Mesorhabditis spiculigera]
MKRPRRSSPRFSNDFELPKSPKCKKRKSSLDLFESSLDASALSEVPDRRRSIQVAKHRNSFDLYDDSPGSRPIASRLRSMESQLPLRNPAPAFYDSFDDSFVSPIIAKKPCHSNHPYDSFDDSIASSKPDIPFARTIEDKKIERTPTHRPPRRDSYDSFDDSICALKPTPPISEAVIPETQKIEPTARPPPIRRDSYDSFDDSIRSEKPSTSTRNGVEIKIDRTPVSHLKRRDSYDSFDDSLRDEKAPTTTRKGVVEIKIGRMSVSHRKRRESYDSFDDSICEIKPSTSTAKEGLETLAKLDSTPTGRSSKRVWYDSFDDSPCDLKPSTSATANEVETISTSVVQSRRRDSYDSFDDSFCNSRPTTELGAETKIEPTPARRSLRRRDSFDSFDDSVYCPEATPSSGIGVQEIKIGPTPGRRPPRRDSYDSFDDSVCYPSPQPLAVKAEEKENVKPVPPKIAEDANDFDPKPSTSSAAFRKEAAETIKNAPPSEDASTAKRTPKRRRSSYCAVYEYFSKQQPALERKNELAKTLPDARVFTEQLPNNAHRYIATAVARFWRNYEAQLTGKRHFFELIEDGMPCRLYFDLEYDKPANPGLDASTVYMHFINTTIRLIHEIFDMKLTRKNFLALDSTTDSKYSCHVIVHLPGDHLFPGGSSIRFFTDRLAKALMDRAPQKILNRTGNQVVLFDPAVYSKNRLFRLLGSSKVGKDAVLKRATYCTFYGDESPSGERLFLDSLCVPAEPVDESKVIDVVEICLSKPRRAPYAQRQLQFRGQGTQPAYGKTPFPELEQYLKDIFWKWKQDVQFRYLQF